MWITFEEAEKKLGKALISSIGGCNVKTENGKIYIDLESDKGGIANNVRAQIENKLKRGDD